MHPNKPENDDIKSADGGWLQNFNVIDGRISIEKSIQMIRKNMPFKLVCRGNSKLNIYFAFAFREMS